MMIQIIFFYVLHNVTFFFDVVQREFLKNQVFTLYVI